MNPNTKDKIAKDFASAFVSLKAPRCPEFSLRRVSCIGTRRHQGNAAESCARDSAGTEIVVFCCVIWVFL